MSRPSGKIGSPAGDAGRVPPFDINFDHLPALLTIPEFAALLQVSETTVRRLQQQRKVPFVKIGGGIRFIREDVIAHVTNQRVEAVDL